MIYNFEKEVKVHLLEKEIRESSITIALDYINQTGSTLTVKFKASLSQSDESTLFEIVSNHDKNAPSPEDPILVKQDAPTDEAGRMIVRTAATIAGWHYIANFFEYETSSGELYCFDAFGNNLSNQFILKRYDLNGNETTNESSVAIDKVTWKPNYDYEIIAGSISSRELATEDVRIWVIGGAIELGSIGTKEFVRGINLKYVLNTKSDGRASKLMKKNIDGIPYQTNQLQFIFKHNAGFKHKVLICVEVFKQ
jgi:hypothetical protein